LVAVGSGLCGAVGAMSFAIAGLMVVGNGLAIDPEDQVPASWYLVPLAIGSAAYAPFLFLLGKWYVGQALAIWKVPPPITLDSGWPEDSDR